MKTVAYWSGVVIAMIADGDLGLDDVFIFLAAAIGYWGYIWRSNED